MYIQTDIRIRACADTRMRDRMHYKKTNITFRSKELDVRKVRDV